jgi:signal transduction histidine kinase
MSLSQTSLLLVAVIIGFAVLVLCLSAFGVDWRLQAPLFLAIVVLSLVLMRRIQAILSALDVIGKGIDDTARGELTTPIPVNRKDEIGKLAGTVESLRRRLAEMNQQLFESLRVESLNILGSVLVHDMKNFSFRLRTLSSNIDANYTDPAFRASLVRTLNETTTQMERMVKRFREREEVVIVKIRADLNEVVHSALRRVRREENEIQISEQFGSLPQVWVDPLLIESAMFRLFENARDAMPRGGLLAVRTRVVQGEQNGGALAAIEIADTGSGISQEFIAKDLFTPFATTKPRGLGLGLYTCRQIILMHDGEIKVRSEVGKGTVFSIFLPITD